MWHRSLDTIGIAGFGHDFKTLDGHPSAVIDAFEAFGDARQGLASQLVLFATAVIPILGIIPTTRITLFEKLGEVTSRLARKMLEDEKKGKEVNGAANSVKDTSILGLLGKGLLCSLTACNAYLTLFSEGRICH